MKKKQTITITIDTEVYLKIRLMDKINLSGLINDYLKETFSGDELNKEKVKSELEEIKRREHILSYELEKIKAREQQEQQKRLTEEEDEREALYRSIPLGNNFYDRLQREKILKENPKLKARWEREHGQ